MAEEHQAPDQITPKSLGDYLEVMTKAVFQSGISWRVVEKKWPGIRAGFRDFDAEAVAKMGERDIDRLASDERVIRNRRKIEATIENANRALELEREHGSFKKYLRSHGDDYYALEKDLRRQFKFLGEFGVFYFLHVVKEEVPDYEEWQAARKK